MSTLVCALGWRRCRPILVAAILSAAALSGCRDKEGPAPAVKITEVPVASAGGPAQLAYIAGTAQNVRPGEQVVLYAHGGNWWVQPTLKNPFTQVQPDATWKNETHLGTEYAALLVDPGYQPAGKIAALPAVGNGVAAEDVAPGKPGAPVVDKVVHFSGYDWSVRAAASARGGETNAYDPSNVWVDQKGYLHLRMGPYGGAWTCAELSLTRGLGYGTYSFVVEDAAHMEPSAVVGLFILGDEQTDATRRELDIELGRWGIPAGLNVQYVVQPYYVAQNIFRFAAPGGTVTHSFRWEPGSASFSSNRAQPSSAANHPVSEHVFSSGIPGNSGQTVHIDLYDFHHSINRQAAPTEVMIEKFQYLP
jgi:hypothetical protein